MDGNVIANNVYWFCLLLGGGYVLVQFVLLLCGGMMHGVDVGGGGHDLDGMGGGGHDIDGGFDTDGADTHVDIGASHAPGHVGPGVHPTHGEASTGLGDLHVGPFSPMSIALFLTGFGGMGLIVNAFNLPNNLGVPTSILGGLISLVTGLLISAIVILMLNKFFEMTSSSSGYSINEVIGKPAVVDIPMDGERTGEISYNAGHATRNDPARPLDKKDSFKQGDHVFIAGWDDGTFLVVDVENASSPEIKKFMEQKVDV
jgi:hypothetical protein